MPKLESYKWIQSTSQTRHVADWFSERNATASELGCDFDVHRTLRCKNDVIPRPWCWPLHRARPDTGRPASFRWRWRDEAPFDHAAYCTEIISSFSNRIRQLGARSAAGWHFISELRFCRWDVKMSTCGAYVIMRSHRASIGLIAGYN